MISPAQAILLLRLYAGINAPIRTARTIDRLIELGYLAANTRAVQITLKGRRWCNENHLKYDWLPSQRRQT